MPEDKSIREKLVHQGAGSLTNAELISVVIHEGGDGLSAVQLSQNILDANGENLCELSKSDIRTLRITCGLGIKRAAILTAAFELGRRAASDESMTPTVIRTHEDVETIFRPLIASLRHEEFWALYLSSANTVVGRVKVSQGGVSGTVVDHKLILKRAVELLASGIVLIHNHPSGIAEPSGDDKRLTEKIEAGAALFDISVLDHLIITSGGCFSFRRAGIIK